MVLKPVIRSRGAKGFTLVELLVVISIIGMLMGLLLPAVQSARETGRRNTCNNNMRQLCLAITQFEGARRVFPGYLNKGVTKNTTNYPVSFVVKLFPYMERNDLATLWTGTGTQQTTPSGTSSIDASYGEPYLEVLVCPSNPPIQRIGGSLAYILNSGCADAASAVNNMRPVPVKNGANGVFSDSTQAGQPTINMDYLNSHDGTSNTLMASENVQAGNWTLLYPSVPATDNSGLKYSYSGRPQLTFAWWNDASSSVTRKINGNRNTLTAADSTNVAAGGLMDQARPASNHPGGVNVFFCDTHNRFISEDIDNTVYKQLMTPYGTLADDTQNAVLDESQF